MNSLFPSAWVVLPQGCMPKSTGKKIDKCYNKKDIRDVAKSVLFGNLGGCWKTSTFARVDRF
jgi:hypothetical protein